VCVRIIILDNPLLSLVLQYLGLYLRSSYLTCIPSSCRYILSMHLSLWLDSNYVLITMSPYERHESAGLRNSVGIAFPRKTPPLAPLYHNIPHGLDIDKERFRPGRFVNTQTKRAHAVQSVKPRLIYDGYHL